MSSLPSNKDFVSHPSKTSKELTRLDMTRERSHMERGKAGDGLSISNGEVVPLTEEQDPKRKLIDLEAHFKKITDVHVEERQKLVDKVLDFDDFQIGSVRLKVPPTDILITDTRQFEISSGTRNQRVFALRSGSGLLQMDLTLVFSGKDVINKQLREIIGYFKMGPFCTIRSPYLYRMLLVSAPQDATFPDSDTQKLREPQTLFETTRDKLLSDFATAMTKAISANVEAIKKKGPNLILTETNIKDIINPALHNLRNVMTNQHHRHRFDQLEKIRRTQGKEESIGLDLLVKQVGIARGLVETAFKNSNEIRSVPDGTFFGGSNLKLYKNSVHISSEDDALLRIDMEKFLKAEKVILELLFSQNDTNQQKNSRVSLSDDQNPIPVAIKSIAYRTDNDPDVLVVNISLYLFNHTPYVPRFLWKNQFGEQTPFIEEAAWYNKRLDSLYLGFPGKGAKVIKPFFKAISVGSLGKHELTEESGTQVNLFEMDESSDPSINFSVGLPEFKGKEDFTLYYPLSSDTIGDSIAKNLYERFDVISKSNETDIVLNSFAASYVQKLSVQPTQAGHYATLQFPGGREGTIQVEFALKDPKIVSVFNRMREETDKLSYKPLSQRKPNSFLVINNELMNLFGGSFFQIIDYKIKPIDPDTSIVSITLVDQTPRPPVRVPEQLNGFTLRAAARERLMRLAQDAYSEIAGDPDLTGIDSSEEAFENDSVYGRSSGFFSRPLVLYNLSTDENLKKEIYNLLADTVFAGFSHPTIQGKKTPVLSSALGAIRALSDALKQFMLKVGKNSPSPTTSQFFKKQIFVGPEKLFGLSETTTKESKKLKEVEDFFSDLDGLTGFAARSKQGSVGFLHWMMVVAIEEIAHQFLFANFDGSTEEIIKFIDSIAEQALKTAPIKGESIQAIERHDIIRFLRLITEYARSTFNMFKGEDDNSSKERIISYIADMHSMQPQKFYQLVSQAQDSMKVSFSTSRDAAGFDLNKLSSFIKGVDPNKIPHFIPNRKAKGIDPYPDLLLPTYEEILDIDEIDFIEMLRDQESIDVLERFVPDYRYFGEKAPVGVRQSAMSRVMSDLVEPDFWWFKWDSSSIYLDPFEDALENSNPVESRAYKLNKVLNGTSKFTIPVELTEVIDGDTIRVKFLNAHDVPYLNIRHNSDREEAELEAIKSNNKFGYSIRLTNFTAPEAFLSDVFGNKVRSGKKLATISRDINQFKKVQDSVIKLLVDLRVATEGNVNALLDRAKGITNIKIQNKHIIFLSDFVGLDASGSRFLFAASGTAKTLAGVVAKPIDEVSRKGTIGETKISEQEEKQLERTMMLERANQIEEPKKLAYAFPTVSIKFIFEGNLRRALTPAEELLDRKGKAELLAKLRPQNFRADVFIDAPIASISILQRAQKIKVAQISIGEFADSFTNDRFFLFPQQEDFSLFETFAGTDLAGTAIKGLQVFRPRNIVSPGNPANKFEFTKLLTKAGQRVIQEARKNKFWFRDKTLREGTRITIRMGYSSNIEALPIRFTGIIAERNRADQLDFVAQSYDAQVLQPIAESDFNPDGKQDVFAEVLDEAFDFFDAAGGTRFLGGIKNQPLNMIKMGSLEWTNLIDVTLGTTELRDELETKTKSVQNILNIYKEARKLDTRIDFQGDADISQQDLTTRLLSSDASQDGYITRLDQLPNRPWESKSAATNFLNLTLDSVGSFFEGIGKGIGVTPKYHGEMMNCFIPWETQWSQIFSFPERLVGRGISIKSQGRSLHSILDEIIKWFPEYVWYFDYFDDEMRLFIGRPTGRYVTTSYMKGALDDLGLYFLRAEPLKRSADIMTDLFSSFREERRNQLDSLGGMALVSWQILYDETFEELQNEPQKILNPNTWNWNTGKTLSFISKREVIGGISDLLENDAGVKYDYQYDNEASIGRYISILRAVLIEDLADEKAFLLKLVGKEGMRSLFKSLLLEFSFGTGASRNITLIPELSNFEDVILESRLLWGSLENGVTPELVAQTFSILIESDGIDIDEVEFETGEGNFRRLDNKSLSEDEIENIVNDFVLGIGAIRYLIRRFVSWLRESDSINASRKRELLYQATELDKWKKHPRQEIFRKEIFVTSFDAIIANNIKASTSHMYNGVTVTWDAPTASVDGVSEIFGGDSAVKRWISVAPEDRRILHVDEPHVNSGDLAALAAQSWLARGLAELYQGELILRGRALKPFDIVYINDLYNGLYGPVVVDEIIETFNVSDGYVSVVMPKMYTVAHTIGEDWIHSMNNLLVGVVSAVGLALSIGAFLVFPPFWALGFSVLGAATHVALSEFKEQAVELLDNEISPNAPQDPTENFEKFQKNILDQYLGGVGKLQARDPLSLTKGEGISVAGVSIFPLIQYGPPPRPYIAGLKGVPISSWKIADTVNGLVDWVDQYIDDVVFGLEEQVQIDAGLAALSEVGRLKAATEEFAANSPGTIQNQIVGNR